ncbi:pyridine nucleotide-disulfide oxidoreductase [Nocardia nova]|uniref:L-aspartate oxidase n=1 Tax=Nocardia nova TaxID=37330 RepID=A0A2S5ZZQ3_9NOCA|nr:pyridine nucleotide-disulfide oxidoreductase [Nocardia nova]
MNCGRIFSFVSVRSRSTIRAVSEFAAETSADVLVVGGGPAGAWAALTAATAGARVILVDKGRCGECGPTSKGFVALWDIPPGPERERALAHSLSRGGDLGDPEWMDRVLGETHHRIAHLLRWGYRQAGDGPSTRVHLEGRRYLAALRRTLFRLGVQVVDHHPALYLLVDADGVVCGAGGLAGDDRYRGWTIRAGAVVLATGGCAFLAGGAGTDVDTGEGLLMAAEAGTELSGMEFSGAYGLATMSDLREPRFASLYDESGARIDGDDFTVRSAALTALAEGRAVYAEIPPESAVRYGPASAAPSGTTAVPASAGADASPSAGRVRLRPVLQGTVRGSGGIKLTGFDCATTVPGLYVAGDVASREPITGAVGGFDGHGGGWAISSGMWAGSGAARFARHRGRVGDARPVPGAGLNSHPGDDPRADIDPRAVIGLVQEHTLPLRRSYWRSAGSLRDSIAELDAMWPVTEYGLGGAGADQVRARQAAALLAVARWTKYSALARTETRGLHRRTDHPGPARNWRRRLLTGGVNEIWVRPA